MELMKRQVTAVQEADTTLSIDYYNSVINIYSNKANVVNKLLKRGFTPVEIFKIGNEIEGMAFQVPCSETSKVMRSDIFKFNGSGIDSEEIEEDEG